MCPQGRWSGTISGGASSGAGGGARTVASAGRRAEAIKKKKCCHVFGKVKNYSRQCLGAGWAEGEGAAAAKGH